MRRRDDHKELLKQSLLALEREQKRVQALEQQLQEPLAVVGMACRFPGGVNDASAYWDLLRSGRDAIAEVPPDRWDANRYYAPEPRPLKANTRWGGFLEDIAGFDHGFFRIPISEARAMDPQARQFLEVCVHALQDAGLLGRGVAGSRLGVFAAVCNADYYMLQAAAKTAADPYSVIGNSHSMLSGRVAYLLDLHGPALTVDTACSSSLVALHLASHSLRARECEAALVGGSNAILSPEHTLSLSLAGFTAADGRCKGFDARADGYVRSEGCGVLVLKRLRNAIEANDRSHALVLGTAVNHNGHSAGLTAPNAPAQQRLLRQVLAAANVTPEQVQFVEAPGTGTTLGDPIEFEALQSVLGGTNERGCWIGSAKGNVGHLEAVAGVAGLMRASLALKHQEVPPQLHFERANPALELQGTRFTIPTQVTPWPSSEQPRCALVTSLGFNGTNAQAVLQEAPTTALAASELERPVHLLVLCASSSKALEALVENWCEFLRGTGGQLAAADLCYSAQRAYARKPHRIALLGANTSELLQGLKREHPKTPCKHSPGACLALAFTTADAAHLAAAEELRRTSPAFRSAWAQAMEAIGPRLEAPAEAVLELALRALASREPRYLEPLAFAFQWSLATTLRDWGVRPPYTLGDGVGELAAACLGGALDLKEAAELACRRGSLLQTVWEPGVAPHELPARLGDEEARGLDPVARELVVSKSGIRFIEVPDSAGQGSTRDVGAGYWARRLPDGRMAATHLPVEDQPEQVFMSLGPAPDRPRPEARGTTTLIGPKGNVWRPLGAALATLFERGAGLDLDAFDNAYSRQLCSVPPYPFEHTRLWFEPTAYRPDNLVSTQPPSAPREGAGRAPGPIPQGAGGGGPRSKVMELMHRQLDSVEALMHEQLAALGRR